MLFRSAGDQQTGAGQIGGQAGVEIPQAPLLRRAGDRIAGQQVGAEIELQRRRLQLGQMLQQGLAEQTAAGAQISARAARQGQLPAQVGQAPGAGPFIELASKPGTNSPTVGTSGNVSRRTAVVTAKARSLPARMCSSEAAILSIMT